MTRTAVLVAILGCGTSPRAPVQNTRPVPSRPEPALDLDPEQCQAEERVPIDDHDSVAVVTCTVPAEPDASDWPQTAYFVRGRTPTTGTKLLLGEWRQGREFGRFWTIAGVTRDANHRATRVVLQEGAGGIDGPEGTHYSVYDPISETFTKQRIDGLETKLVVAPGGASAHVVICKRLTSEFELGKTCEEVSSTTQIVPIE